MKNPYEIEPTRFMKRNESDCAIECWNYYGPVFGNKSSCDISLINSFSSEGNCSVKNDGTYAYECHPQYKSSLFVTKHDYRSKNCFSLLDYEVYCIENYKDYIYNQYKYPDIIWEYIETKDISEESLKQFNDEEELFNDLNVNCCEWNDLRLKISQYYFKNPSEFLPDTQIVNQQYDSKLREWLGNEYKWKLLYRASEHEYTAESFHKYCDNKGPTLIVIKSSEGWIFGGYTTQSWIEKCIL